MKHEDATFWFPAKSYGWGWGLPVKWQGWAVLGVYFLLLFLGIKLLHAQGNIDGFFLYLGVLTVALIAVIAVKGERPLGWRWGK